MNTKIEIKCVFDEIHRIEITKEIRDVSNFKVYDGKVKHAVCYNVGVEDYITVSTDKVELIKTSIDELGRLLFPSECRKHLNFKEHDTLTLKLIDENTMQICISK